MDGGRAVSTGAMGAYGDTVAVAPWGSARPASTHCVGEAVAVEGASDAPVGERVCDEWVGVSKGEGEDVRLRTLVDAVDAGIGGMEGTVVNDGRRDARACASSASGCDGGGGGGDARAGAGVGVGVGTGRETERAVNSAVVSFGLIRVAVAVASTNEVGGIVVMVAGVCPTSWEVAANDIAVGIAAVLVAAMGKSAAPLLLVANCNVDEAARFGDAG